MQNVVWAGAYSFNKDELKEVFGEFKRLFEYIIEKIDDIEKIVN